MLPCCHWGILCIFAVPLLLCHPEEGTLGMLLCYPEGIRCIVLCCPHYLNLWPPTLNLKNSISAWLAGSPLHYKSDICMLQCEPSALHVYGT